MNDNQEKTITLYPSNWLYNAGVVGFLRVLEEAQEKMDDMKFEPDGSISLSQKLFIRGSENLSHAMKLLVDYITKDEDIKEWLEKKDKAGRTNEEKYKKYVEKNFSNEKDGYKYIRAGGKWFFGSNTPYQNLVQKKEWEEFKLVELIEDSVKNSNGNDLACNFCKNKNISISWLKKEKSLEKRLTVFADPHTDELGASIGKFPNSFWNNQNSILICPLCVFLFVNHRIAFSSFNGSQIFVNTPHFKLTYDLNKFVEEILKKEKQYEIRKLLGSSLLQWAIKRRTLLGVWTMMNIEVIIKRRILVDKNKNKWETIIDYFDLPYHITRILLDTEIASLINAIGEEKIFDLIVSGKFSELEKANYFVLRSLLKLKNNEKISENDPITKYADNYHDKNHLIKVSNLLPELYAKITKILKMEVKYGWEIY